MTPHTLRRTFASLLAAIGVSPRRAMYLLGHTDQKFTMRVYQQVLDLGGAAAEQLERARQLALAGAPALHATSDSAARAGAERHAPPQGRRAETAAGGGLGVLFRAR